MLKLGSSTNKKVREKYRKQHFTKKSNCYKICVYESHIVYFQ